MTIALALEYIPRRMQELGYGNNYYIRFRHLVLQPGEKQEISAFNQLYILVNETDDVNITSETGTFDLSLRNANEMQYEHQGVIKIYNNSRDLNHLRFIQVIPKNKKK